MLTFPLPSCSEVRRELEAAALNELSIRDLGLVRLHLLDCTSCRSAAGGVRTLIRRIRRLGATQSTPARAAFAASILALIALAYALDLRHPRERDPASGATAAAARLVAVQCPDGAWREAAIDADSATSLGLSGLATLACLGSADDPAAIAAARRGSAYLARVAGSRTDVAAAPPPGPIGIRAQAAAAWALREAARRWPEFRAPAAEARRELAAMRDRAPASDGLSDAMTTLLLTAASSRDGSAGATLAAHEAIRSRLRAADPADAGARSSITRLVGEFLAASGGDRALR